MNDTALTCEKCGADLRVIDEHSWQARDHHRNDCAALAAANARIAELQYDLDFEQKRSCGVCLGDPLVSGNKCVCGGRGTLSAEARGLREMLYDSQRERDELRAQLAAARQNALRAAKGRV